MFKARYHDIKALSSKTVPTDPFGSTQHAKGNLDHCSSYHGFWLLDLPNKLLIKSSLCSYQSDVRYLTSIFPKDVRSACCLAESII